MEKRLGNIFGFDGGNYAGNVYDSNFNCPTLNTMQGGCKQPMVIDALNTMPDGTCRTIKSQYGNTSSANFEYSSTFGATGVIVAMRGRNPNNPSDRTAGAPTEQRLEPNSQGICNTLTSVQKDNLVMEVKQLGFMDNGTGQHQSNTVYDEKALCPNITTINGGGTQQIKICKAISTKGKENEVASTILAGYERTNMTGFNADNGVCEIQKVGQISSDGSQCGTVISENGISSNLVAGTHGYANSHIQTQYRIRKLTPKECWRLMDFKDEDFEKAAQVNSNTQLYKQAGNSIVRNVLVAILGQMIPGKENVYKEINNAKT